jgi:hypothetical protein
MPMINDIDDFYKSNDVIDPTPSGDGRDNPSGDRSSFLLVPAILPVQDNSSDEELEAMSIA